MMWLDELLPVGQVKMKLMNITRIKKYTSAVGT